jgi:hypothetical protein
MNISNIITPIRFSDDAAVSSSWKMAEKLIDFGGKARKVVMINPQTNKIILQEDKSTVYQKMSWVHLTLKVAALAALYLTVIGGIAHISILASHRYKNTAVIPSFLLEEERKYNLEALLETLKKIPNQTVERYSDTLIDRDAEIGFNKEELEFMHNLKLKDMTFNIPKGEEKVFHIYNTATRRSMGFSNRSATRGELREDILRGKLKAYKSSNPDISLYNAIQRIITSADSDVYQYTKPVITHELKRDQISAIDKFAKKYLNQ